MAKAPAVRPTGDERRQPTEKEASAIALAHEAKGKRPSRVRPPASEAVLNGRNSIAVQAPHADAIGWGTQMMEAFGVDSYAVVERLMVGAGQVARQRECLTQEDADEAQRRSDYALSWVSALEPRSAIEATLGLQMLATHEATMRMSAGMHNADDRGSQADYARLMNQSARTFAAQIEALSKLRTGGKQQVEVRYVYVDARTQTVVNTGGEQGGALPNRQQPHAPDTGALGYAPLAGLPMWGDDASGDAVPVASDPGQAPVSDARRQKSGRSTRRSERQLSGGAVDQGNHSRSRAGSRPRPSVSGNAS